MDNWIPFQMINFADESISAYHIDTRDFHCSVSTEKHPYDFSLCLKYKDNFYHTPEEVIELLNRYFIESGGTNEWRFFDLDHPTANQVKNWNLKYVRIYREPEGLIVANNHHYAIRKDLLVCKVAQEFLDAHSL